MQSDRSAAVAVLEAPAPLTPLAGSDVDGNRRSPLIRLLGASPKLVLVTLDAAMVAVGMVVSKALVSLLSDRPIVPLDHSDTAIIVGVGMVLHAVFLARYRLYVSRFVTRGLDEMRRVLYGAATATFGIVVASFALKIEMARSWVGWSFAVVSLLLCTERCLLRRCFPLLRRNGLLQRRIVLLGSNAEGRALLDMFRTDLSLGYRVVGVINDAYRVGSASSAASDMLDETLALVREKDATGVVIATTAIDLAGMNRVVRGLTDHGVHVELSSSLCDIASNRLTVRLLGRFPVMYVEPVRRSGWRSVAKRCFDIVAAGAGLIVLAPLLLVVAILIKLDSPGPVIFRQERVGRDGRLFELFKFRTMVSDAEDRLADVIHLNEADGPLFKLRDDPRITRIGAFLRRRSIDELPQLLNVLRNDMSIVGPRPALAREAAQWDAELRTRLRVRPGLTGMWQVLGRSDSSFDDYQRLDLYYVDNWSLAVDLMIVLRTVPSVLRGSGAR